VPTEKRVKVGIIGAGWAGQTHARFYKNVPFVDVVAWADMVPGKAEAAAKEFGVPNVYLDYKEMLAKHDLDGVSVCTFNKGHKDPAIDCLKAGKHILLEKPMAADLDDAKAIMQAWERSDDRILMVGFQPDFSQEHQAAKQIFDSGMLGDVYYSEAVTHRRFGIPGGNFVKKSTAGAGTLVDTGVYAIHNNLWLMGDPKPVSVSAITGNPLAKAYKGVRQAFGGTWTAADFEVEEFAAAFVRFENGSVMVVKSSWAAHADTLGRSFFLGTKAGLALGPLEIFENHRVAELNFTTQVKGVKTDDWAESWTAKMHNFAAAVRDGQPSPIDPRGVYLVNVVMDGILRSAAEKREVQVDASYTPKEREVALSKTGP
jgi:predicted dehydrogenase